MALTIAIFPCTLHPAVAAPSQKDDPPADAARQSGEPEKADGPVRVLDPEGKPFAGAKVYCLEYKTG